MAASAAWMRGVEVRTIRCSEQTYGTNCTPCPDCANGACNAGAEGRRAMRLLRTAWTGATCRAGICDPACVHGVCTEPDVCKLRGRLVRRAAAMPRSAIQLAQMVHASDQASAPAKPCWSGALCDSAICQTPCGENATCVAPDTCTCNEGYFGNGFDCEPMTECSAALDWTPCAGGCLFLACL